MRRRAFLEGVLEVAGGLALPTLGTGRAEQRCRRPVYRATGIFRDSAALLLEASSLPKRSTAHDARVPCHAPASD